MLLKNLYMINYSKLVIKIDTTGFVLKTTYDTDKSDLFRLNQAYNKKINDADKEIPDTNSLVKKSDYNSKITEIENKISDVSNLVKKNIL